MGTNKKMAWQRIIHKPRRRTHSKHASPSQTRCHAIRDSCSAFVGGGGGICGWEGQFGGVQTAAWPAVVCRADGSRSVHKLLNES